MIRPIKRIFPFVLVFAVVVVVKYSTYKIIWNTESEMTLPTAILDLKSNQNITKFWKQRATWQTSGVGEILFKNASRPPQRKRRYNVLAYKGRWLQDRHTRYFTKVEHEPLETCAVKNCDFFYDEEVAVADIVVFHLFKPVPKDLERRRDQIFAFLTDESPWNSIYNEPLNIGEWAGFYNWSMSYRSDADIPVPYGRTVPRLQPDDTPLADLIPNWKIKRKDVAVAIMISHCTTNRMRYVRELQKYMRVDIVGHCSDNERLENVCPGRYTKDCDAIDHYYFYMALENSRCFQYMTEKLFHNAYGKGAIPIMSGTDPQSAKEFLPINSFLHINHYPNPEDLANELRDIIENDKILEYHEWRRNFTVLEEHGYFQMPSIHLCRICEALNYNSMAEKVYDEQLLAKHLDPKLSCVVSDGGLW